jgi:hypothetical protein
MLNGFRVHTVAICKGCNLEVTQADQTASKFIRALGSMWHPNCFYCGSSSNEGECCKTKLEMWNYHTYDGAPFCLTCMGKVRKKKRLGDNGYKNKTPINVPVTTYTERILSLSPRNNKLQLLGGTGTTPSCPSCNKPVYKMEEIKVQKSSWHRQCFTCGGTTNDGCNRVLSIESYEMASETPFCKMCYKKILTDSVPRPTPRRSASVEIPMSSQTPSTSNETIRDKQNIVLRSKKSESIPKLELPDESEGRIFISMDEILEDLMANAALLPPDSPSSKAKLKSFRNSVNEPTCPLCHNCISKSDEFSVFGVTWHKQCFCCGGNTNQGCKRMLGEDDFEEHNALPFCKACASEKAAKFTRSDSQISPSTRQNNPKTIGDLLLNAQENRAASDDKRLFFPNADGDSTPVIRSPRSSSQSIAPSPRRSLPKHLSLQISPADTVTISAPQPTNISPSHQAALLAQTSTQVLETLNSPITHIVTEFNDEMLNVCRDIVENEEQESSFDTLFPNQPKDFDFSLGTVIEDVEKEQAIALTDLINFTDVTFNDVTYRGFHLNYNSDFDENGVLYWIGSRGKSSFYRNPHTAGYVIARMSSVHMGSPFNIVSRTIEHSPNYTFNKTNSWVEIDFGERRLLLADKYTIRHGGSASGNALRNWELQARVSDFEDCAKGNNNGDDDDNEWITIKSHFDDDTLHEEPNSSASWDLEIPINISDDLKTIGFRYYRIFLTGPNSSGNYCLFCCGLELYGILFERIIYNDVDRNDDSYNEGLSVGDDDGGEVDDNKNT